MLSSKAGVVLSHGAGISLSYSILRYSSSDVSHCSSKTISVRLWHNIVIIEVRQNGSRPLPPRIITIENAVVA